MFSNKKKKNIRTSDGSRVRHPLVSRYWFRTLFGYCSIIFFDCTGIKKPKISEYIFLYIFRLNEVYDNTKITFPFVLYLLNASPEDASIGIFF